MNLVNDIKDKIFFHRINNGINTNIPISVKELCSIIEYLEYLDEELLKSNEKNETLESEKYELDYKLEEIKDIIGKNNDRN